MRAKVIQQNSRFVSAIRKATELRRSRVTNGLRPRNGADDLLDDNEALSKMLNECFWAGLNVEEGRTVSGSICVCSPSEAQLARAFSPTVEFSVPSLVALLTASPRSPLAVHWVEGELVIWGVLDSAPMLALKIRIVGNGTIVASVDGTVFSVFERGLEFVPINNADTFQFDMIVQGALAKTLAFGDRFSGAVRIRKVVAAMHQQGHGGALVVVPPESDAWLKYAKFKFEFDMTSSLAIQRRLGEIKELDDKCSQFRSGSREVDSLSHLYEGALRANNDILDELLRSVGNLSAIDGAVVVDENLKIYGFGAKLDVSPEKEGARVNRFDALSSESVEVTFAKLGGTRHQSAARFVYQHHEAMVFVSSQDGRLTLFAWLSDQSQVIALTRLEHFFWDNSR